MNHLDLVTKAELFKLSHVHGSQVDCDVDHYCYGAGRFDEEPLTPPEKLGVISKYVATKSNLERDEFHFVDALA